MISIDPVYANLLYNILEQHYWSLEDEIKSFEEGEDASGLEADLQRTSTLMDAVRPFVNHTTR